MDAVSPFLMAAADKESLCPESMTKKYLAGVRALVSAAARLRLRAPGQAERKTRRSRLRMPPVPKIMSGGSRPRQW